MDYLSAFCLSCVMQKNTNDIHSFCYSIKKEVDMAYEERIFPMIERTLPCVYLEIELRKIRIIPDVKERKLAFSKLKEMVTKEFEKSSQEERDFGTTRFRPHTTKFQNMVTRLESPEIVNEVVGWDG